MRIDKNEQIEGLPILKIRDALRKSDIFHAEILSTWLSTNIREAQAVLEELTNQGYLENCIGWEINGRKTTHKKTTKGNALTLARAIKPISKQKAQLLLDEFLERVYLVNKNKSFLYSVRKVTLFGSFINDNIDDVGDIDMVVHLDRREPDSSKYLEKKRKKISTARKNGKSFKGIMDEIMYPINEVQLFLKSRSRYLSFHHPDDLELESVQTKTIQIK